MYVHICGTGHGLFDNTPCAVQLEGLHQSLVYSSPRTAFPKILGSYRKPSPVASTPAVQGDTYLQTATYI